MTALQADSGGGAAHSLVPMPEGEPFRVLQLTDFHTDASDAANQRTWEAVRRLAVQWRPHFLAVTGDIWCGDGAPDLAPGWMERDIAALGALGAPWALVLGNHDYVEDLDRALTVLRDAPGSAMPPGDGRGNFRVSLCPAGAHLPAWDLYFLNSHAESLEDADVAWLEAEAAALRRERGRETPSIVYFHIPLKQYEIARLEGRYTGIAQEEVLYWGDDGTLFPRIRDAGGVRACFAGHSHVNDFYLEEDGVILGYGRCTGYGGYGGHRLARGATLVELEPREGRFSFKTVFPDGAEWRPSRTL